MPCRYSIFFNQELGSLSTVLFASCGISIAGGAIEEGQGVRIRLPPAASQERTPPSRDRGGARTGQQGPFYIFAAFVFTYGTTVLHRSRNLLLAAVMCATARSAVTIPLAGHLSERFGRASGCT